MTLYRILYCPVSDSADKLFEEIIDPERPDGLWDARNPDAAVDKARDGAPGEFVLAPVTYIHVKTRS